MNEVAICKIMSYIENNLFEPGYHWDKCIFKERSYSRWAAYEILERLMDNPFKSPEMIIEEFIITTALYSCVSGNNATYDLWLSTVKTNIVADSIFQKKALMRDLRKSADKGTLKIVATNQSTLENIELEPQQLLFVNRRNLSYVRDKILANQEPYILIYDNDYDIVEEMLYSAGNKAVNTIAIRTADEASYYNNTLLIEKELVADGRNPTRYEYTIRDDSFCVERRADLKFETLDFNL